MGRAGGGGRGGRDEIGVAVLLEINVAVVVALVVAWQW